MDNLKRGSAADENAAKIQAAVGRSFDFITKRLQAEGRFAIILYINGVSEQELIHKQLTVPFYHSDDLSDFHEYLKSMPGCSMSDSKEHIVSQIWHGSVAICVEDAIFLFDAERFDKTPISESTLEMALLGPTSAFTENISINIGMIRQRYLVDSLVSEQSEVGQRMRIAVALLFDQETVNDKVLSQFRKKLQRISPKLERIDQFQQMLNEGTWSIFPTVLMTERPDRVVKGLTEGKVILLVQGTPLAFIVPTSIFDFMSAMDDLYYLPIIRYFLLGVRYFGLAISVLLPGLYIAITSFNPEFLRVELALTIAGSRLMVPYPTFIEVLLMVLMMELLSQASVRLPRIIGPAGTTVGGLILGQASAEARLVSNIMVIIVAAVAIGNFVIPNTSMSFAVRVMKYPFILLAVLFGLSGIVVGIVILVFYLAHHRTLGKPFMQTITGKK